MKYFIALFFACTYLGTQAQIKGVVSDKTDGKAIIGAHVYWLHAKKGTATNTDGIFELALPARLPDTLIVSFIGYLTDTFFTINQSKELVIRLESIAGLNAVEIKEKKAALSYNTIDPFNKQSLSKVELKKAACCNLSESFETSATVDVSFSDAVSGSKQIKMLGLDGAYSLFTFEQLPGIRGLSINYGLAHIPGTWVDGIDITKGIGSVVNGYEGISGHVNIELDKPEKAERLFVNVYAGDAGRVEANIQTAKKINPKWSTLLFTHVNGTLVKNDYNKDGFLDVPLGYQFNALNRWKYENTGKLVASFGVQALMDNRTGGSILFTTKADNDTRKQYGVNIETKHVEGFGKLAIGFHNQPYKSLGIYTHARAYLNNSYFGLKKYNGTEYSYYNNFVYQSILGSTDYKYKAGVSFMYDKYNQTYNDTAYNRTEIIPGIFGELNYDIPGKVSVLLGLRSDYHNLYGLITTPRVHFKYQVLKYTTLRLSGGRGMHVANIFIENAAVMASNRQVIITENLKPELAWNYGSSITHSFKLGKGNTTVLVDFYRTDFESQVIADLYTHANQVRFYNLNGKSYSNSFQTELIYEPIKKLEVRLAYKYQEVKATYSNILLTKPLVAKNRVLVNVGYATKFDKWKFDATYKWFGTQQLPATAEQPHALHTSSASPIYYTVNTQITRGFKKWETYIGVENLFNYMQHHQIIDAQNPFGNNFDASVIWGPNMGRVIYAGIRILIK